MQPGRHLEHADNQDNQIQSILDGKHTVQTQVSHTDCLEVGTHEHAMHAPCHSRTSYEQIS